MLQDLATKGQIDYLNALSNRAQGIKRYHPSLIPQGLYPMQFQMGLTKKEVGLRIQMYKKILEKCDLVLPRKTQTELFPES